MEQKLKGSGFLKVVGILMIIGGGIGCIVSIMALLAAIALVIAGAPGLYVFACILVVISSVAELIAGILGVKHNNNKEKATTLIVWGFIVVAISVIGSILEVAAGQAFPVLSFLIGLVIPALYVIGAFLNKGDNGVAENVQQ